jgi:hypothetical protein
MYRCRFCGDRVDDHDPDFGCSSRQHPNCKCQALSRFGRSAFVARRSKSPSPFKERDEFEEAA